MGTNFEKDLNDEVYEDSFYDDEEELTDEEEDASDDDESEEVTVSLSFVCDDCDYRWDDQLTKSTDAAVEEEPEEADVICPMCGSMNVSQI